MIGRRFEQACERFGLNTEKAILTTEHFHSPVPRAEQLSLFG
jgi:hypothetical protein